MFQTFSEALGIADTELELSVQSKDYIEGVTAFREKRLAVFKRR